MNEYENKTEVPILDESVEASQEAATHISIPVLNEIINQELLEAAIADNVMLPDGLREQLTSRITQLVQQKLHDTLPEIMNLIQEEISDSISQHITDTLPSVINELLKQPK